MIPLLVAFLCGLIVGATALALWRRRLPTPKIPEESRQWEMVAVPRWVSEAATSLSELLDDLRVPLQSLDGHVLDIDVRVALLIRKMAPHRDGIRAHDVPGYYPLPDKEQP